LKSKDYEARQVTRGEEIEAINKAIEIIASPEVSGAGQKHLPSFLQERIHTSVLAQLRGDDHAVKEKVVSLLLQASQEAKSDLLAMVANRVGEDPFAKVKKMIKDLIVKLMDEANSEADHKGFCDKELATNKATRDEKSAEVTELTAQIDELTSKNAKLTQDIADLNNAVAELDAAVKEATEARSKEKAANTATLADAKAASAAVSRAISVLKEYYAKAAQNTALVQAAPEDAPETFNAPYKGQQSESGGVLGMLEVIQSDFARLEAETSSGEDEAQREHDTFLADSSQDKEVKEKEARHKGFDKVRTERALSQAEKDLKATQAELDAALEYFDKLKPQCIDTGLSYEERVAKRKAEIISLQEALKVLSGEDI
jgi:DNA repair exonuclease SbcCD ATPase subunit